MIIAIVLQADSATSGVPTAGVEDPPAPISKLSKHGEATVCAYSSHERLLVRPGRDVCAATLNSAGRPTAMGFVPTRCSHPSHDYVIDVMGMEDRCFASNPTNDTASGRQQ